MNGLTFDIAHMLAGSLVVASFLQLYQDRLSALINVFAVHAMVLALSVAWQAYIQDAPHLYITAVIALAFKAIIIPVALRRIVVVLASTVRSKTSSRRSGDVVWDRPGCIVDGGHAAVTAEADPLAREIWRLRCRWYCWGCC